MDQRPPPCAHRAPHLPVPPTTMRTALAPLYTAAWPHHPDAAYRPLLPDTVGVITSDHGQTSTAGYSCSPYSVPSTFSQMGITFTGTTPCGPDSETQDNRFPLSQPGKLQMLLT